MSQECTEIYPKQQKSRYKLAGQGYKTRLLDKVFQVCGYKRKYASKLLRGNRPLKAQKRGHKVLLQCSETLNSSDPY